MKRFLNAKGAGFVFLLMGAGALSIPLSVRAGSAIPGWDTLQKFLNAEYRLPQAGDVVQDAGDYSQDALSPERIRVVLWNVLKGEKPGWFGDFFALSQRTDLFLIQEAIIRKDHPAGPLSRTSGMGWLMAKSFYIDSTQATGVATGSVAAPVHVGFIASTAKEPLVHTPKMSVATLYRLRGSAERLLVLNVHGINFVTDAAFGSQLEQIEAVLATHRGPVILAGDFNTWNSTRRLQLLALAWRQGLRSIRPNFDHRFVLVLDHAMVRGLSVRYSEMLNTISSSDHTPIYFEVSLARKR